MSKTNPIQRKSKAATSSARLELLNKTIESTNNSIFESETFHDFITFKQKIKNEIFPKGFVVDFQEDCVWFYYIVTSTDQDGSPTIDASVKVSSTLKIDAFIKSCICLHHCMIHYLHVPNYQLCLKLVMYLRCANHYALIHINQ